MSSIGTFNYQLASFLGELVKDVTPSEYSCKDTFTFLNDLRQHNITGKFMVSFDVCSLFTNIPLNETIDLAVNLIFEKKENLKITKKELTELFIFATAKTYFLFNGIIYDQVDGIAMGSPLAPTLANLFMGYHETNWLSQFEGTKPTFYRRYVDDIFATFTNENDANTFFDYLNNRHTNIKFTKEYNKNCEIPFLDILINNKEDLKTTVYHKETCSGLLMNFKSFVPSIYKNQLIHTLVDRTYKINSSWVGFHLDITKLTSYLLRNIFPRKIISRAVKRFLDEKLDISKQNQNIQNNIQKNVRYFKLPYIGELSKNAKAKIDKIVKRFCKENIDVKIIFNTNKISSFFSTKDPVPILFTSNVVYKFVCQECNSCFVGRTYKYFDSRRNEHLVTDKSSAIFKHLESNTNCKLKNNKDSFSVIDFAKTDYELALKEAMHIKWINPNLNGQKRHEIITLLI